MSGVPNGENGEGEEESSLLLQLHPAWRQAVKTIVESAFPWGHILTFEWLYQALDIPMPTPETPLGAAQRTELQFLGSFKRMEKALLEEHQIALKNLIGIGYVLMPPQEQADWGYAETLRETRRAVQKGFRRVTCLRLNELSDAQRASASDKAATLANLSHLLSSRGLKAASDRKALTGDSV